MRFRAALLGAGLVLVAGCSNNPTTPSSGSGGNTSVTQIFSGTVAAGERPINTFTLPGAQGLHVTFGTLTDSAGKPVGMPLKLEFGVVPDNGVGCNVLTSATAMPALQAQLNLSVSQGEYCIALSGTDALPAQENYSIRVTYGTPSSKVEAGTVEYSSTVEPTGFTSRTFEVSSNGTVTVIVDAFAPASVAALNVGVGYPRNDGSGCVLSLAADAGRGAQFGVPVDVGRYCVRVSDPGTLTGTTTFTVRIVRP